MTRELRIALRSFSRQPGLWILAVVTLAVGIGASAAVFALVRNVYERPLSTFDAESTVVIRPVNERGGRTREQFSAADLADLRTQARSFSAIEAYRMESPTLVEAGEPRRLPTAMVSPGLWRITKGRVALGRGFVQEDYAASAPKVAIVSDALWKSHFGGRASALGQTLRLGDQAVTVIGVAWPGTWFPATSVRIWVPLYPHLASQDRARRDLEVLAQLRPGVALEGAAVETRQIGARLAQAFPATNTGWTLRTYGLLEGMFSENDKQGRRLLFVLAAGILLLAAINVANLILSRSMLRRQELAIRQSLGASRGALLKQGLAEGMVIAWPAAVLGLTAALWASHGVLKLMAFLPYPLSDQPMDAASVAFGIAASLLCGVLLAVMPLVTSRHTQSIREDQTRTATSRHSRRLSTIFVAGQTAIALMLLTAAGFAVKGVLLLQNQIDRPGYATENLATLGVSPEGARYKDGAARRALYRNMESAAASVPGVESAAMAAVVPVAGGDGENMTLSIDGRAEADPKDLPAVRVLRGSERLAATLRLPIGAGRFLAPQDDAAHPAVALINQHAAKRFWPGASALGQRVKLSGLAGQWFTIVGVYGDLTPASLILQPQVMVSLEQFPAEQASAIVRFQGSAEAMIPRLQKAVQAAAPLEPLKVDTVSQALNGAISGTRIFSGVLSVLGALALLLAGIGIFSLLSFQVLERMREIGIRVALGAGSRRIAGAVIRDGMRLTLWGVLLGLPGAWLVGRGLSSMLPGLLEPGDVSVAATALGALLLGALLACIAPLRRALSTNPAELMHQS